MTALWIAIHKWPERALAIDRVWLATGAILGLLAVMSPGQASRSLGFVGTALLGTAPFLLLSVALAGYCTASGADKLVARAFQGRAATMVILAAAVGALSPFCSCGVIPLIAALLGVGVPLAPVMAFWLASPLMDPSMFVLTFGLLGIEFAIGKTVAAFAIGLLGGFGIWLLMQAGLFREPLRAGVGERGCGKSKSAALDSDRVIWWFWNRPDRRLDFLAAVRNNALFLAKWLVLAFVLESLMVAYVPTSLVIGFVGDGSILSVFGAALVGVPAYLNGYAALPVISGLIGHGMAPSAAMAFLIAGGVTSIPAAIAVFALARPPVFAAYIGFAFIGAVSAGLAFGAL